jgi:hypothetical protein
MHDLHLRFVRVSQAMVRSRPLHFGDQEPALCTRWAMLYVGGRTLEDTVEFFNIVLELKLASQEKQDLVTFMRQL